VGRAILPAAGFSAGLFAETHVLSPIRGLWTVAR